MRELGVYAPRAKPQGIDLAVRTGPLADPDRVARRPAPLRRAVLA
jgi:hypothetical protein